MARQIQPYDFQARDKQAGIEPPLDAGIVESNTNCDPLICKEHNQVIWKDFARHLLKYHSFLPGSSPQVIVELLNVYKLRVTDFKGLILPLTVPVNHIPILIDEISCTICDLVLTDKKNMVNHIRAEHKTAPNPNEAIKPTKPLLWRLRRSCCYRQYMPSLHRWRQYRRALAFGPIWTRNFRCTTRS